MKKNENNSSNIILEEEFEFQSPVESLIYLGLLITRVRKKHTPFIALIRYQINIEQCLVG
jgi:hypothetical protein